MNVHAVFYDPPLPNGNTTRIGIVIRDDEGQILAMITGTLGHLNQRANELWAILLGLRLAHKIRENAVELETESADALREWADWRWFVDPRHSNVVQQLNQRLRDPNLLLRRRAIVESRKQASQVSC